MTDDEPVEAVTVTGEEAFTAPAVTVSDCVLEPAATFTDAGTGTSAGSLLESATETPPEGAGPESVREPVAVCPLTTVAGVNESDAITGGSTVNAAERAGLPASVAVIVAEVLEPTGTELT